MISFLFNSLILITVCMIINCSVSPSSIEDSFETTSSIGSYLVDVKLQKLYRYRSSRPDHMSDLTNQSISGYTNEGYHWYILPNNSPFSGTQIYRLRKDGDHMTSLSTNEGGYQIDGPLGKLISFSDPNVGLYPIVRYYKSWKTGVWPNKKTRYNHLDANFSETPTGYIKDGNLGYGWIARKQEAHIEQQAIDYVTKTGISNLKIGTSWAWGGSIVSLIWNNTEFVNRYDAGREIQTALHVAYNVPTPNVENPTEAGDAFSNGSPIINYDLYNGTGRIVTQVNSLRWGESDPTMPTADNPVLSGTIIGKDVKILDSNLIEYNSWFNYGKTYSNTNWIIDEAVTPYLTSIFDTAAILRWDGSNFQSVWTGYARGENTGGDFPHENRTATTNRSWMVMAYNNSRNIAVGLLCKTPNIGKTTFCIYMCNNLANTNNPLAFATLKLAISELRQGDNISAGTQKYYTNYIIIGTKNGVITKAGSIAQ